MQNFRNALLLSSLAIGCSGSKAGDPASPLDATADTASTTDANGTDATSVTDTALPSGDSPTIGPCRIFPADNPWNSPIDKAPVHKDNAAFIAAMSPSRALHPDWGNWSSDHYGIPWQTGTGATPVKMTWTTTWGARESDKLPCAAGGDFCYPIPSTVRIEGGPSASSGSDRHVLFLDTAGAPDNCTLYELYNTQNWSGPDWRAANGAIFKLGTNALRPEGWTSADAAGLPILPGLVRLSEVRAGAIKHAIRFTMANTSNFYIHPATHAASSQGLPRPPMGLRVRLKSSFVVPSGASAEARVIMQAMKTYGLILADNGSDWYITGDSDDGWDPLMDGVINALDQVHGSDFEVVETGPTIAQPD